MMTKQEKSMIRQLIQSQQWTAIMNCANIYKQMVQGQPVSNDSEWELAKDSLMREGKIRGVDELFQEIYKVAQSDE